MKKLILSLLPLLLFQGGFAQNEANIWYFGFNAGLDFNGGAPVALLDGQVSTLEGVATISNAAGDLLFYTDGITVWDRNHNIMPNGTGLFGDPSSSQSGIIVPKPQSSTIYYIFTVAREGFPNGVNYSEVDITLNGGMGDVTNKNVPLLPQSTEQITAVAHANGTDVWVVTHDFGNSQFRAFHITPAGVNTVPVTSIADPGLNNTAFDTVGCMKASPDGTKIAMSNYESGPRLFDFNNTTGEVSNGIMLATGMFYYGVEFSPSGKLLYVSNSDENPPFSAMLYQFDLEAADIPASVIQLIGDTAGVLSGGALQLGPDAKIYFSSPGLTFLSVIHNPDEPGAACDFEPNAVDLAGRMVGYGLPPFIQSWFMPQVQVENLCFNDETHFSLQTNIPPDSVLWEFGDGDTSTAMEPVHTYAAAGGYTVTLTAIRQGIAHVYTKDIEIEALPVANEPDDMVLCDTNGNGEREFDLTTQDAQILGTQPPPGYEVTYHLTEEDAHDGINALLGSYTNTSNPQVIYARVTSQAGCHAETSFELHVQELPVIEMELEYTLCEGNPIVVAAPDGFDGYLWSTGAGTQAILIEEPGTYSVTVFRDNGDVVCEATAEITASLSGAPTITRVEIRDWTHNDNSVTIIATGPGDYEYSVDGITYQDSPVFEGLATGRHFVYVRDKNGCGIAKDEVYLLTYPKFFTPNGDGENETWRIKFAHTEPDMDVHIYDRYGKLITSFKGSSPGWDGTLNGYRLPSTDYWFVVKRQDGKEFKGHFSMIR